MRYSNTIGRKNLRKNKMGPDGELLVIGDVHGHIDDYMAILNSTTANLPSVQLGDMGFNVHYQKLISWVDPGWHKFIPGNHDDYEHLPLHAFDRQYGIESLGNIEFFFVRGAYSIDQDVRTYGVDWWPEEEMSDLETWQCLGSYDNNKPKIVLSHDGPSIATKHLVDYHIPNRTGFLLDQMYAVHKPCIWIFGHHHKHLNMSDGIGKTHFICLPELQYLTIERWGNTYRIKRG